MERREIPVGSSIENMEDEKDGEKSPASLEGVKGFMLYSEMSPGMIYATRVAE